MNGTDIFLIVLLGAAAIRGYFKGLTGMAAKLAGVVAGVVLCRCLGARLAARLPFDPDTATAVAVAHIVLFLIGFIGCLLMGRLIGSALRSIHLGFIDRIAGAAVGLLVVAVLVSLVLNLWAMLMPASAPASASSAGLRGLLYDVAPALAGRLGH